jgi:hypothetical protein
VRWQSTHLFRITMELVVSELEKHANVEIVTCPTNNLIDEFDDRYTEEFICTDPDRWLPYYDKTDKDAVRKLARLARVEVPPRIELPPVEGLIIHDRNANTLYEGTGSAVVERVLDNRKMEALRQYARTAFYVSKNTHPYTWEYLHTHPRRSLIWRMRCGVLPTGEFAQDNFGGDRFLGRCLCSMIGSDENPEGNDIHIETIGHMLLECPLYTEIRVRLRGKRFSNPVAVTDESLATALGWIPEIKFPPDRKLGKRMKHARKAITTAIAIWQERNAIRDGIY